MHFFKHIIFDLDDTLLDFKYAQEKAFFSLFSQYGVQVSQEDFLDFKEYNRQLWRAFEAGSLNKEFIKNNRFDKLITKYQISSESINVANSFLENIYKHCKLLPSAQKVCEKLSTNSTLHALTNGIDWLQKKRFQKAGLDQYFVSLTTSDECQIAKPAAEIFRICMQKTTNEYNLDEVLIVGDSLSSDIQGGINFGCKTCWYNPSKKLNESFQHDYEISSLDELIK